MTPQPSPSNETTLPSNETSGTCLRSSNTSAPAPLLTEIGFLFDGLAFSRPERITLYAPPVLCFNETFVEYEVTFRNRLQVKVCTFTSDARTNVICCQTPYTYEGILAVPAV